jgi:hypothetical protein
VIYEQKPDYTTYACDCCGAIWDGHKAYIEELLKGRKHHCRLCMQSYTRFLAAIVNGRGLPAGPVRKRIK